MGMEGNAVDIIQEMRMEGNAVDIIVLTLVVFSGEWGDFQCMYYNKTR